MSDNGGMWVQMRLGMALVLLAAICGLSCQSQSGGSSADEGQVVLALTIPGGATISSVSWAVKSSSNQPVASGTVNTSRTGATASFAVGLQAGTGYVVTLTATTSAGDTCSGSSSAFNVVASQTSPTVNVNLICGSVTVDGGLGSVLVTGTVVPGDSCPVLASWTISPDTAAANGGQIDISATATDADSDTLTYQWSAAAGSFANVSANNWTYTCGAAGSQVLHLTVSDGHTPVPCSINVAFPAVSCN
jgi:hypothetical protein